MSKKPVIQICKSVAQCGHCEHRVGSILMDGDEAEITCEMDLEKNVLEIEADSCPQFNLSGETVVTDADDDNPAKNVGARDYDSDGDGAELSDEEHVTVDDVVKLYIARDSVLIEVKRTKAKDYPDAVELPMRLAEAINRKVADTEETTASRIQLLKQESTEYITSLVEAVTGGDIKSFDDLEEFADDNDDDDVEDDSEYDDEGGDDED